MESIILKKCNCGNFLDEHYFNTKTNEMVYVNDNSDLVEIISKNKRCNFFFNNNKQCLRSKCSYKHIKDEELPNKDTGKMSLFLNKHTRNGILGWFRTIDDETHMNVMNNIHNIKSLITTEDRKACIEFIKLIYTSRLYYNIIKELNKNELGITCDFLMNKFNLICIFGKIHTELKIELVSTFAVLTYLPGIYLYDNLYYSKQRPIKRKLSPPGALNFKVLLSKKEKQMRSNKQVIIQPKLNMYSDWIEKRSRTFGIIYYVNKITGEKSWKHPITQETNLPGGYKTPEEAGLLNNA